MSHTTVAPGMRSTKEFGLQDVTEAVTEPVDEPVIDVVETLTFPIADMDQSSHNKRVGTKVKSMACMMLQYISC